MTTFRYIPTTAAAPNSESMSRRFLRDRIVLTVRESLFGMRITLLKDLPGLRRQRRRCVPRALRTFGLILFFQLGRVLCREFEPIKCSSNLLSELRRADTRFTEKTTFRIPGVIPRFREFRR